MDEELIVELDNIHKTYLLGIEGVPALRGVSLKIHQGEWVVIYGTSGGGKTTMLNVIGTIDKPTKGEMVIGDARVTADTTDDVLASIRLNTLGFVFQTFNLLTAMTALENVELPMVLKGDQTAAERRAIAKQSLEKMGLGERLGHYPNMLSGGTFTVTSGAHFLCAFFACIGEQQRVTIARAIANKPKLLLLDEPTGDLDTKNTRMVIKMLRRLNEEEGMTLVMVTHDVHLKNFAKRIIWMRDGKVPVKIKKNVVFFFPYLGVGGFKKKKILKTERVDPKKRVRAFAELQQQEDAGALPEGNPSEVASPSSTASLVMQIAYCIVILRAEHRVD